MFILKNQINFKFMQPNFKFGQPKGFNLFIIINQNSIKL